MSLLRVAPAGGFAGDADRGVYNNCSASGTVTGQTYAGGFIGHIVDGNPKYDGRYPAGTRDYLTDEITIADCSILFNVTGKDGKTGGIVGYIEDGTKVTLTDNKYAVMPRWNPCVDPETVLDENENEYSDTYTVTVALDGEGAFPVLLKFFCR